MRPATRRTLIVLAAALAAVWACRHAGTFLDREDPLRHADAIYVLAGMRFERALDAADLYRAGYAPVVLLSPGQEEPAERLLREKGVRFPREAEPVRDALSALGLPRDQILIGDGSVDNTAAEARLLRETARQRGWRTVIVVTAKYHTRRTGFAMRRGLEGSGVRIIVRASR